MPSTSKSAFNATLSSLLEPTPVDFDPEAPDAFDDGASARSEDESDEETKDDPALAREHYVSVGKSRLRMGQDVENLGPQYSGAKVSRDKLEAESEEEEDESGEDSGEEGGVEVWGEDEDIDSEEAFSSGDEERFKEFKFKGSRTTEGGVVPERGDRVVGSSGEDSDSPDNSDDDAHNPDDDSDSSNPDQSGDSSGEQSDSDSQAGDDSEAEARRTAMTKLLQKEASTIQRSLTAAQRAEQSKGLAIQHQQKAYDRLLSTRIKLQPVLQTINTLPATPAPAAVAPAYTAALALFNTISTLRAGSLKRKFSAVAHTADDSLDALYGTVAGLTEAGAATVASTLEKWAAKTATVTAGAGDTLAGAAPKSITAGISAVLAADLPRLVARTQVPRACAPGNTADSDPAVFDDTDFYGQLLRALVDARAGNEVVGQAALEVRETKKRRKDVDTKASKGRKLRYHVHEKLVGFMAPVEGWERWRDEQRRELFMGLLGQRRAEEDDGGSEEDQEEEEEEVRDTGLRLFG